jgi:hypothetical protein
MGSPIAELSCKPLLQTIPSLIQSSTRGFLVDAGFFLRGGALTFKRFAHGYKWCRRYVTAEVNPMLERPPSTTNQQVAQLTPLNWQKTRQSSLQQAA